MDKERLLKKLKHARIALYNNSVAIEHVIEDIIDVIQEMIQCN